MRLVHDDVAEVLQDVAPAVVVREHADMEHVRVREDHVRPLADLPAALGLGVPVVDGGAEPGQPERGERTSLVLRERLRRIEVERAVLRVGGECVQDRQVECERLPARRAGGDHDVLATLCRGERSRLVLVELAEPTAVERLPTRGCKPGGRGDDARLPGCYLGAVDDLLGGEELVPGEDVDCHRSIQADREEAAAARALPGVVVRATAAARRADRELGGDRPCDAGDDQDGARIPARRRRESARRA